MKKIAITGFLFLLSTVFVLGQGAVDALRYSRTNIGGTARFMAMGGAFGALGADFTMASTNPAGIGLYKKSEISVTPAVFTGSTKSFYNGMTGQDSRSNFYMGNAGIVFARSLDQKGKSSGWKYVQFATGLNRIADYNNRMQIVGPNPENSLLDTYVEYANGTDASDIESDLYGEYAYDLNLAWWTFLLDLVDTNITDVYDNPIANGGTMQAKDVSSKGSMNEYVMTFGANYGDRLYIGATIGIPYLRYYETAVYSETDAADTIYDFRNFERIEDLETRGNGFNFKFGLIYRASDWMRIGVAAHTPTWFTNMQDYWQVTMISRFDNNDYYDETSPLGNYYYELTTPFRVQGSLGFIIGNVGVVSADYEFTDFGTARLDAPDYSFHEANDAIQNSYAATHTFRAGTEWRYNVFSFRLGGSYQTSPYQNNINTSDRISFSGGIGIRSEYFFADIAYAYTGIKEDYYLYSSETVWTNPVENKLKTHSVLLTLGAKF
jgi:hypothetical protein